MGGDEGTWGPPPAGPVRESGITSFEETLGNGIVTNRAYDAVTHWLAAIQSGVNGGSGVKNLEYLYDEVGNVRQRQDNNLGLTENIYYDNDYRLSTSQLNSTENLSVSYDEMGDITSRSDVAGGATWTYDTAHLHALDQAGSSAYAYGPYDANGNPSSARGATIDWSSYNYPISISASTGEQLGFSYGPGRRRWQQVYVDADGDTETTDYLGQLMEHVSDSEGTVTDRDYIYAGSEPVAVYSLSSGGNALNYFLTDQEGSPSALTNRSGQTVVNESYTAFGERRNPSTWSGPASSADLNASEAITRQAYTFQTALGEDLGFTHMNGRVQDAITGRFLSPDPFIQAPSNAQNYNRYSYVFNNPLSYTDPTGFDGEECSIEPFEDDLYTFDEYGNPDGVEIVGTTITLCLPIIDPDDGDDDDTGPDPTQNPPNLPGPSNSPSGGSSAGVGGTGNTASANNSSSTPQTTQATSNPPPPCSSGPNYLNRYTNFVSNYAIDIGPYAVGLLGGVWPKSLVPWTGGAGPALAACRT